MELEERIGIIIQGAEIAQKNGALTLDDAYYAKQAVDAFNKNVSLKEAYTILNKTINIGQKKGAYSLRDAYYLYIALEGFEKYIPAPTPVPAAPAPGSAPEPTTEQPATSSNGGRRKKES